MRHAFLGPNRVPVPPVFRQPFSGMPTKPANALRKAQWRESKRRTRAHAKRQAQAVQG